ncbi:unnamed protein product [Heligmosomoides polygyrus]|uniref:Glutaredoxin domain-containing protein n=1 Tax=Heligmosomoides polygyrus TaxID=6339 RepID=A0A183GTB2_HELPZ|nr:unnamed protein product [Heligmosomoides polygyrus]
MLADFDRAGLQMDVTKAIFMRSTTTMTKLRRWTEGNKGLGAFKTVEEVVKKTKPIRLYCSSCVNIHLRDLGHMETG